MNANGRPALLPRIHAVVLASLLILTTGVTPREHLQAEPAMGESAALTQNGDAIQETNPTLLLRMPAVSRDHVAFVYANDLWIVDRAAAAAPGGADARRLTSAEGAETNPRFSPDGRWIAFTGEYGGQQDVYVIPAEGGEPRRLTHHPGGDMVQGWTPDGSAVLFTSGRMGHPTAQTRFYTVSLEGGLPEPLPIPRGASGRLAPDGRHIAYQVAPYVDPEWRNYRGGQALPTWIVSMEDYELTTVPWEGERHMSPVWLDDTVYFLSERDWSKNVWSYAPAEGELRQRTFHHEFDVKHLDGGGGVIVYEQGGRLHLLDPTSDETRPLEIRVRGDQAHAMSRWAELQPPQLQNGSLSPTGQRALFEARGQLLTVPAEHGDWRNVSPGSDHASRFPAWSPDGSRIAYFTDRSGEYRLELVAQDGMGEREEIALPGSSFYFGPTWSPDGTRIAYRDAGMSLWYVELATGNAVQVDTERHAYPERSLDPIWSPDSRWLAYARRLDSHLRAIFVHDTETGRTHQLTDGLSDAYRPQWDASGDYLYFLASTDYGLNTGWLDMSSFHRPVTRGIYLVVLADDEPSPLAPRSDEEPVDEEATDAPDEEQDEAETPEVRIDFEDLDQRILALPVPQRNYTVLRAATAGTLFYGESIEGQPGLQLHRFQLESREAQPFLSPVHHAAVSHDGQKLLYRSGNQWGIVNTSGPPPSVGDGAIAVSGLRVRVDPVAEWEQMFEEGWRIQRDFLYVENLHGAPWEEIREQYRPWLAHVRHRTDLTYLLEVMGGELAVGHSFVGGGDVPSVDGVPPGLLGADLELDRETGAGDRYRIARIYRGENWNPGLEAPLTGPGLDVAEGEYLLAVDGVELRAPGNPFALLEGTAGRQTVITVNDRPTMDGARDLTVVPVSSEGQLRTRQWMDDNRRRVEELSDGRLAYVWLPNTSWAGYTNFNRYYFAQQDREGAIIDERDNGGGSAADYIVDVLARELQGYFNSPVGDRKLFTQPIAGLFGPKVMVINEMAGSGGDLLPYLFRQRGVGPLVGTRTWGGLVGIWDSPPLVDGGFMLAPRGGFVDLDGEWAVENEGVAPDIEVVMTPRDVIDGRDPQLERAVEEALRLLETEGVEFREEPDPPVRWRRASPPG
jgi:tricorn protease